MSLTQENVRIIAVCPVFPLRLCGYRLDSSYPEQSLQALARHFERPIRVLALRREGEPAHEVMGPLEITRVEPADAVTKKQTIDEIFLLEENRLALAEAAALAVEDVHDEKRMPVAWIYGSECAQAASAMRRAGAAIVGVMHRLWLEETMHALRAPKGSAAAKTLMTLISRENRDRLVRWAGAAAGLLGQLALPEDWTQALTHMRLERRLIRASHQLISVGEHFRQSVQKHYPETQGRWTVALPGADLPEQPWSRPRLGRRRLLMWGQGHPLEGWEVVASVLEEWLEESPSLAERLELMVLAGPKAALHRASSDVLERFHHLPNVQVVRTDGLQPSEIHANLQEADGFIDPSWLEASAERPACALTHGVPVITSYADGPRDVMQSDLGFRAEMNSPARAKALRRALTQFQALSADDLSAMERSAQMATAGWSWEVCGQAHWEACLRSISMQRQTSMPVSP